MKAALKIIFLCLGPGNSYILLVHIYIFTSAFFRDDSGEMEDYAAQEGHKCFVCWSSSHHAISSKEVPGCDLRVSVRCCSRPTPQSTSNLLSHNHGWTVVVESVAHPVFVWFSFLKNMVE